MERGSDNIPHRGRLVELPGSVMPGMWEASVRSYAEGDAIEKEGLHNLLLSLRHVGTTNSTPLEKYYSGEENTPKIGRAHV